MISGFFLYCTEGEDCFLYKNRNEESIKTTAMLMKIIAYDFTAFDADRM